MASWSARTWCGNTLGGHHLRDRVRLVRLPRRVHELGPCPLGHLSLDAAAEGLGTLEEQLAAAAPEDPTGPDALALEALVIWCCSSRG
jgi:RNA polymerase sigma-B factor